MSRQLKRACEETTGLQRWKSQQLPGGRAREESSGGWLQRQGGRGSEEEASVPWGWGSWPVFEWKGKCQALWARKAGRLAVLFWERFHKDLGAWLLYSPICSACLPVNWLSFPESWSRVRWLTGPAVFSRLCWPCHVKGCCLSKLSVTRNCPVSSLSNAVSHWPHFIAGHLIEA